MATALVWSTPSLYQFMAVSRTFGIKVLGSFFGQGFRNKHTMAINRDSLHLKLGDPQPPLKKGILRLYNMRYCPFAQRVVMVLDAKKIAYDTVNCNLVTKPAWLFQKNDDGKVPALEFEDGKVLSESLLISDYLDEVYPKPALYPADPRQKAFDRALIEKFSRPVGLIFKILKKEGEFTVENFEKLLTYFNLYEDELAKRGTPFFGGSKPGMVDLMIWPWFERAPVIEVIGGADYKIPTDRFPLLHSWIKSMWADPSVKLSSLSPEIHRLYLENVVNGVYDFDRAKL